jgi:hypothetical protein
MTRSIRGRDQGRRNRRRLVNYISRRNHKGSHVEFGRVDDVLFWVARSITDATNICCLEDGSDQGGKR